MVSPAMFENVKKVAAQLETHGYTKCEPPKGFEAGFGAIIYFMQSPEGRVTKVGMEAAVDWQSGAPIDLATGKMVKVPPMHSGPCYPNFKP